jgi:hypothetical protein
MALNLPKLAAPTTSEALRLKPMKQAGLTAPKPTGQMSWGRSLFPKQTTTTTTTKTGVNPYDEFTLQDPYKPGQINSLANSGYQADLANATKIAHLGYLSPDQETARATQQGANVKALYDSLAAQIAGIQQAIVGQSNAGSAALGAANTATGATAAPVSGALGVAIPGVQGSQGAQTVLGAQGAAQGNLLGSLQANSYAAGTSGQARALAAGQSNIATNEADSQKTLAQLMAGLDPVSKRTSDMLAANQSVDATNKQTLLGIYQGDRQAEQTAAALGDKDAQAAASRQSARDLALLTQKGENYRTTLTTNAANGRSAASIDAANRRAANADQTKRELAAQKRTFDAAQSKLARGAALNLAEKKAVAAQAKAKGGVKNYYVTALLPATSAVDPNTGKLTQKPAYRKVLHVSAKVWDAFNTSGPAGQRKLSVLGVPEGTKIQASTGY